MVKPTREIDMSQHYSDPSRADDAWSLPDVEVFELTAREVAERDEDLFYEYIEDECITGGWFYWFCFPGCMPESDAFGPYKTRQEAIDASQDQD